MKVIVLYHPNSEHAGKVEDYARDYERFKDGKVVELQSLETVEGAQTAKLYDITAYPAVLALADDGSLQNSWQGEHLPLMAELDAYTERPTPKEDDRLDKNT